VVLQLPATMADELSGSGISVRRVVWKYTIEASNILPAGYAAWKQSKLGSIKVPHKPDILKLNHQGVWDPSYLDQNYGKIWVVNAEGASIGHEAGGFHHHKAIAGSSRHKVAWNAGEEIEVWINSYVGGYHNIRVDVIFDW
jgi:hypothetical protein